MNRKNIFIRILALSLVVILSVGVVFASAEEATSSVAPIAENLELKTFRGVSVGGRLRATSPDGGALIYEITTSPNKGTVELGGDGSFVYTPAEGKRGRDYFGYKAIDAQGNYSSEATVIIKIEKQKSDVFYSDMEGSKANYAAVYLAENDIFVGERVGGEYIFNPAKPVTRGEFLTMCLKMNDFDILSGVLTTGFADDALIPDYQKPYVSTALLSGIVTGYTDGVHSAVFSGAESISYAEAAVMLSRSMNLTDVAATEYSDAAPAWAAQAVTNISACKISDYDTAASLNELTRADCALFLTEAMRVLENR
jgi:hypothetical protein